MAKKCKVDGCHADRSAKGFCPKHYQRWKRTGITSLNERMLKHGMTGTKEYISWAGMKARCHNPNNPAYKDYGGRGISVCKEWKTDFRAFYRDMGSLPFAGAEIDRIDNDGNYEPGNCRWVTQTTNARNTRRNILNTWMVKTIREMHNRNIPRAMTCKAFGIRRDVYRFVVKQIQWRNI